MNEAELCYLSNIEADRIENDENLTDEEKSYELRCLGEQLDEAIAQETKK